LKTLSNSLFVNRLSKTDIAVATLLVLLLSSVAITALPLTSAHEPAWQIPTYAFLAASPDPVGVDQTAFFTFWIDKVPPTAAGTTGDRWTGYQLTIVKPDGSTEIKGPFTSYAESSYAILYTPDQVGTYTITFNFPGQTASLYNPDNGQEGSASEYVGDYFMPSSATTTLTVTSEDVQSAPSYPLPSSFWSRPIEGQNTAWTTIASNWLGAGVILDKVQPDGAAPNSGHVMWVKEYQDGGIVGGDYWSIGSASYYTGLSYQGKFTNPIIIHGRLYYTASISDGDPTSYLADNGPYMCVDLLTGETLWTNDEIKPTFGMLYLYESMNQHGVQQGYLVQSTMAFGATGMSYTWDFYDSLTGNWAFKMTNVPSGFGPGWFGGYGSGAVGSNGEILIYQLNIANSSLSLWTSAALPISDLTGGAGDTSEAYQYRPMGKTVDMSNNYLWSVSIPEINPGASVQFASPNDILLVSTTMSSGGMFGWGTQSYTMYGIGLADNNRGQILWQKTYAIPDGNKTRSLGPIDVENRVFTMVDKETMQWLGYDLDSGNLLWGPVGNFRDFQYFGQVSNPPAPGHIYDGKLVVGGYGGELHCFDTLTGDLLWVYNDTYCGTETPWGLYTLFVAGIADGKVYAYSSEHSPNVPPYKGSMMRCINIEDGTELWTLDSWYAIGTFGQDPAPIADGYMAYLNVYDLQVYCIGKGPSQVSVEAPLTAVNTGNAMMIRGTVQDICAGAKAKVDSGQFNIVPAMSDASQHDWMAYIYQQKPMPTDATGVEITLLAFDDAGECTTIGTVTSDSSGMFKKSWTPTVAGEYTIVACFDGTNSYYGASAETAVVVTEAPAVVEPTTSPIQTVAPTESAVTSPTPVVTPPAESGSEALLIAGVAVVIIIAVIAAALVLRKRK